MLEENDGRENAGQKGRFIFIFLDGVGIGEPGMNNPFFAAGADFLPFYGPSPTLPDKTPVKPIDALLGVPGMPMSATGQTSLFTGRNIPHLLKSHRDSYPNSAMRKIIKEDNLLSILQANSFRVRFLNAYPECAQLFIPEQIRILDDGQLIFRDGESPPLRGMISVTSCMILAANTPPYGEADILQEKALYHDFSNRLLRDRGFNLPVFSPEKAAEIIFNTSGQYDFLLYEFFQTDMYGHGYTFTECVDLIRELNRLVRHLVGLLDSQRDTLLITSDHGNIEDGSQQLHTQNPVPLLVWGAGSEKLRQQINSLVDVTPVVVEFFRNPTLFD